MAAIRIVPVNAATDSRQLQFQSARTRFVNPRKDTDNQVQVIWDEVFVFEVKSGVCLLSLLFSFQANGVDSLTMWSVTDVINLPSFPCLNFFFFFFKEKNVYIGLLSCM